MRQSTISTDSLFLTTIAGWQHCAQGQLAAKIVWLVQISWPRQTMKSFSCAKGDQVISFHWAKASFVFYYYYLGSCWVGGFTQEGEDGKGCVVSLLTDAYQSGSHPRDLRAQIEKCCYFLDQSLILLQIRLRGGISCPAPECLLFYGLCTSVIRPRERGLIREADETILMCKLVKAELF